MRMIRRWGINDQGQVGDGTTRERKTPVPVWVKLPPGVRVRELAAGYGSDSALAVGHYPVA
jgi:regulator of chromosome condensation (RCC1) repeat-containing protein